MADVVAKPWSFSDAAIALLPDFSDDAAAVAAAIAGITQTVLKTDLMTVFDDVVADLLTYEADKRILLIISDGEHTIDGNRQAVLDAASQFKQGGGVIIVVGVRASGQGYDLLERIATGGYFINAVPTTAEEAMASLNYLKSLLCAGVCRNVNADTFQNLPALNFSSFLNFEVVQGMVNLVGPGLFDLLPTNGLYVEMASNSTKGLIRTIDPLDVVAGQTYRVSFSLAGNQRVSLAGQGVMVFMREVGADDADPNIFEQTIFPSYDDDFQTFSFSFIPLSDASVRLNFEQLGTSATPSAGNFLDNVKFENVSTLVTLLDDNFDNENSTYIAPDCGPSAVIPAIDNPDEPTTELAIAPTMPLLDDAESYKYAVSYLTAEGETVATVQTSDFPLMLFTTGAVVVTIPLPTSDRVVSVRLWRNLGTLVFTEPDGDLFLLAELPTNQLTYIDSERRAAFEARYDDSTVAPTENTTGIAAGALGFGYADCCYYSSEGGGGGVTQESLVPEMTSNNEPEGTASASDEETGGFEAWRAFDRLTDNNLGWGSAMVLPTWIQYEFEAAKTVRIYRITGCEDNILFAHSPENWELQGSNNGSSWTTLDSQSGIDFEESSPETKEFTIASPAAYKFYRLTVSTVKGGGNFLLIAEIEFFGDVGSEPVLTYENRCPVCATEPPGVQSPDPSPLPDIESGYTPPTQYTSTKTYCATCPPGQENNSSTNLIPEMTSNTTPSGEAIASAQVFFPSLAAWKAFDGSISLIPADYWQPDNVAVGWIGYRFPAAVVVNRYEIQGGDVGTNPKDFTFEGSNNGSSWTVLDTRTNQSWFATELKSFSAINTTAYLYYRLNVATAVGGTTLRVVELRMFSGVVTQVCKTETRTSFISQGDADSLAMAAATAAAQAELNCVGAYTATESFTASCPFNQYGASVTKSATRTSYVSQQDAEAQAQAAAQAEAESELDCTLSNNNENLVINDNTKASPYPSVSYIERPETTITDVVVNLTGLTHPSPDDIRMVLLAPDGVTAVVLMANCGGVALDGFPISNVNLVLDQAAASPLPDTAQIVSGTFRPAQYGAASSFPSPFPTGLTLGTTLANFNGLNPNGSWSIFCYDDLSIFDGSLASWSLTISAT